MISVIVLNRRALPQECVVRCVAEVEHALRSSDHEILAASCTSRKVAHTVNEYVRRTRGEHILFIEPALALTPECVRTMAERLAQDPHCGAVTARIVDSDHTILVAGIAFDPVGDPRPMFQGYPMGHPDAQAAVECESATMACILTSRALFLDLGGLDRTAAIGLEDVDFCLRMRERGLKIICPPECTLRLQAGTGPWSGVGDSGVSVRAKGHRRFIIRWGDRLDRLRLPNDLACMRPYAYHYDYRLDILDLLPPQPRSVLDLGCAGGLLGQRIKSRSPMAAVWGIERDQAAAEDASSRLDRVLIGDLESASTYDAVDVLFDCIICADVLEHLRDPWEVLRRLHRHLAPGGRIVASIPNIGHYTILLDLIRDRWDYRSEGILDMDHVRFFTLPSIRSLFRSTGFEVETIRRNQKANRFLRVLNWLTRGRLDGFLTKKYYLVCRHDRR